MAETIKVVWICHLSNPELWQRIQIRTNPLEPLFYKVVGKDRGKGGETAIWNTNAINEIKKMPEVELHVVGPIRNLANKRQDFSIEGVHYHFIKDENSSLLAKILRYLFTRNSSEFKTNRKRIVKVVEELKPDIVHVIGAENPYYSLSLLDLPDTYPTILQLQALLMSLGKLTSGEENKNFRYKGEIEKRLLLKSDYVGTRAPSFINYIHENVSDKIVFVNTSLAMAQRIDLSERNYEYDFVHFAGSLRPSKGTDVAIRAFAEARKSHPGIQLDLIGDIDVHFRNQFYVLLDELKIKDAVTIEGLLPTHEDVICQIRKARFALLPLKVDIVPNTIHEAMANGLPVITTETPGTPKLNEKRQSVLISKIGDYEDIAKHMRSLLDDEKLAEILRNNGAQTEYERDNNHDIIAHWVDVYKAIVKNHREGTPIPSEYLVS